MEYAERVDGFLQSSQFHKKLKPICGSKIPAKVRQRAGILAVRLGTNLSQNELMGIIHFRGPMMKLLFCALGSTPANAKRALTSIDKQARLAFSRVAGACAKTNNNPLIPGSRPLRRLEESDESAFGESQFIDLRLVCSDERMAALVDLVQSLPVGQKAGFSVSGVLEGNMTLAPKESMVVYLNDLGAVRTECFCTALEKRFVSMLDMSSVKSPSALKKALSNTPQIIVVSHSHVNASPQSKAGKMHAALWRGLVKEGVKARAFMCVGKYISCEQEPALREMYENLAGFVLTNYSDKMGGVQADTLQCIPLRSYFEDVWFNLCPAEE
ncbi:hypothetical protein KIPB_009027 [Kipferlia bialata]|uniref:Uncharacterized protein n=1 Tax=Kipferlia bialata TaxID=797122 RepID=A0A9K3GLX2_9EUKA|nr:hypothetical protein KIPB_009027 [Kipferlia bialata]|eukprot:g9027.t1